MPLTFSVIIPAKNEIKALPHLLAEISLQSLQPVEVIVADASSTDGTVEAAQAAGARVVAGGLPGVGRNAGAVVATGDVLLFLDADIYLPDADYFARCMEEFARLHLDIGACMVTVVERGWWPRFAHAAYNAYVRTVWRMLGIPHAPGACMAVRCSVFRVLGGFSEVLPLAEDMDLALRAVRAGYRFAFFQGVQLLTDTRRMQTDGWIRLIAVYAWMEICMLFTRRVPVYQHYALDYRRPDRKKVH